MPQPAAEQKRESMLFQSAPLVAEGRCSCRCRGVAMRFPVSIRTPRCRGAMLLASHGSKPATRWFQSAPLVAEGRCLSFRAFASVSVSVSIRTPRCRGAMLDGRRRRSFQGRVSIRTPRCRGAMPARLGGLYMPAEVSIRTPRCRGAMLVTDPAGNRKVAKVSIRTPRCRGAMPDKHTGEILPEMFQSAPLVAEGRCVRSGSALRRRQRFNPHPSLPRGDAG